ncbi:MAG: 23S rRNA (adenine(2503)-C(2))-methyltransferase RlmN [Candidatus Magasanikbacteria bacterium]
MLSQLLDNQPKYRLDQIYRAWFTPGVSSYFEITTLPKDLREKLKGEPWMVAKEKTMQISKIDGTKKVLLELSDGACIETVLMGRENKKLTREADERYTICISTQVGCPMGCTFCATGKMGFKRNLTMQEIVDQVRFWQQYLSNCHPERNEPKANGVEGSDKQRNLDSSTALAFARSAQNDKRISNIVLMGQGEPLLNYENVKAALNIILKYTEMGPRQITVSTVGVPTVMEKMVVDKDWPPVRFALSLHNPIEEERKKLIPSHQKDFLKFLIEWSKKYHERFSSRTQFIGMEYTIVPGENDSEKHLKALIKLASKLGKVRINLIPLNTPATCHPRESGDPRNDMADSRLRGNDIVGETTIDHWHKRLMKCGFTTTIRRSQGQDIAAACGQLALNTVE